MFVTEQKTLSESTKALFFREGILWEEGHSERACACDELLLSSGVSPKAPLVEHALSLNIRVTGELDAVAPFLRGRLVAITGSNGKSTTVSLLGHLLRGVGRNVVVAGNIGLLIFGVVIWAASITSVIGAAYTSVSFITGFSPAIARHRNWWVIGFIAVSTAVLATVGRPAVTLAGMAGCRRKGRRRPPAGSCRKLFRT